MTLTQTMMATTAATDNNNDVDNNNLLLRVGKRNDGCDKTKTEEEEMVADSVAVHTTIKQITGRGGGRWRQRQQRQWPRLRQWQIQWAGWPPLDEEGETT